MVDQTVPQLSRIGPDGPPETGTDEETIKRFERHFIASRNSFASWRTKSKRFYDTYAGDPWPIGARQELTRTGRPVTTFNYSLSTLNAIVGQYQADRKEARFQGWHESNDDDSARDQFIGDLHTQLVRKLMDHCQGHREISTTQLDQLITGYGWGEGKVDTGKWPFWVVEEHVDCMEMHPDPEYTKDNVGDGRYLIRERRWAIDDVKAKWPAKSEKVTPRKADWKQTFVRQVFGRGYRTGPTNVSSPESSKPEDEVVVFDYQWRQKEKWVVFDDPALDQKRTMSLKAFSKYTDDPETGLYAQVDEIGERLYPDEIEYVEYMRDAYYRCYLAEGGDRSGYIMLQEPKRILEDRFTYVCATAFRSKESRTGRTKHFGLMELIFEPQMWSAKTLTMIIEMLGRAAKGGGFVRVSALANPDDFIKNQAKPGMFWAVNDTVDKLSDVVYERNAIQWPHALEKLLNIATEGIPYLTAVTDWVKGTATTERSNVLISNLQQQSMTVLNPIMDPLARYTIEMSTLMAKMAINYMAPETINKIVGRPKLEGVTYELVMNEETGEEIEQPKMVNDENAPDGQRPITSYDLLKDSDALDYHVVVDLGTASTTAKQAIWQLFTQTALLQELLADPRFPAEKFLPFLIRNMPLLPAEQSKELAGEVQEELEMNKKMQTIDGIVEAFLSMDPEAQQEVISAVQQQMQSGAAQQPLDQGAPPS